MSAQDILDTKKSVIIEYNFFMQVRGNNLSGMCVIEKQPNNTLAGTVISEFGTKSFDFTIKAGKVKILNLIRPLDHWYIRKILRKDFTFILNNICNKGYIIQGKRRISISESGEIVMENSLYNIMYILTPFTAQQ